LLLSSKTLSFFFSETNTNTGYPACRLFLVALTFHFFIKLYQYDNVGCTICVYVNLMYYFMITIYSIVALCRLRYMFWTDVSLRTIAIARLNGTQSRILVNSDINTPGIYSSL